MFVTVDRTPLRPYLEVLTDGYRRIPVLQMGANGCCDIHLKQIDFKVIPNLYTYVKLVYIFPRKKSFCLVFQIYSSYNNMFF